MPFDTVFKVMTSLTVKTSLLQVNVDGIYTITGAKKDKKYRLSSKLNVRNVVRRKSIYVHVGDKQVIIM